jgi:pyrroline-5-carboxylate reductase
MERQYCTFGAQHPLHPATGMANLGGSQSKEETMSNGNVAVIGGAGKMGIALIDGLIAAGEVAPESIAATARHERSLGKLGDRAVQRTVDNAAAAAGASVIVLSVHPNDLERVAADIRDSAGPDSLLVSIITGASTRRIEAALDRPLAVVRATPNIAAVVGSSMTAVCPGTHANREHLARARRIFETVGRVVELDERHMNSCTGLAGCGPAFAFKIIEALAEGGVKMGLPRDASRTMAAQVLRGAADLVLETGRHPAALKDEVTTPGGCTIDGITKLEARGLAIALIEAVEVSSTKAGLLGGED